MELVHSTEVIKKPEDFTNFRRLQESGFLQSSKNSEIFGFLHPNHAIFGKKPQKRRFCVQSRLS